MCCRSGAVATGPNDAKRGRMASYNCSFRS